MLLPSMSILLKWPNEVCSALKGAQTQDKPVPAGEKKSDTKEVVSVQENSGFHNEPKP